MNLPEPGVTSKKTIGGINIILVSRHFLNSSAEMFPLLRGFMIAMRLVAITWAASQHQLRSCAPLREFPAPFVDAAIRTRGDC